MVRAVKSFADVGRQVEAELTSILPGITVTSCVRALGVCEEPGSETL